MPEFSCVKFVNDVPDAVDYERLARVVEGLRGAVGELAGRSGN